MDEAGDELSGDRLAALDALEDDLARAFDGAARHPLLRRLEPTLRAHALPRAPFQRLIEANRRDQSVRRYVSWDELLGYCRLSANPVGELVLGIFGAATPENVVLSDSICSALQLIEHLQDVREDLASGRIYLPAEDLARFACAEDDLARSPTAPALRAVLAYEALRARALLDRGEPLLARLGGTARVCVAGFAAGGHAALDALERADFELDDSPRPGRARLASRALGLLWRARRGGAA